jgi:hypothetical protein
MFIESRTEGQQGVHTTCPHYVLYSRRVEFYLCAKLQVICVDQTVSQPAGPALFPFIGENGNEPAASELQSQGLV